MSRCAHLSNCYVSPHHHLLAENMVAEGLKTSYSAVVAIRSMAK